MSAVKDSIAQIIKNVDLDKFKSNIGIKIQTILEALGLTSEQAESCMFPAGDKIQDLLSFASNETKVCFHSNDDEIRKLKNKMLSEEATQLSEDILNKLKICKSQNSKCLETLYMDTNIKIVSFGKTFQENNIHIPTVTAKTISEFSKCLDLTLNNMFDKE